MAVTVISKPLLSPTKISASYPAVFKLSSNIYGTAGVTQFRFLADIVSSTTDLGTKYTVVSEAPSIGYIDVANTMRDLLLLSELQYASPTNPLTKLATKSRQYNEVLKTFTITIKEQYYLNGVFTENALTPVDLYAARGFTDDSAQNWIYDNWYRYNGLRVFYPYSGKSKIVYPIRTDAIGWNPLAHQMNIRIEVNGSLAADYWFTRTQSSNKGIVYVPLYFAGLTDSPGFLLTRIESAISTSAGHSEVLQETVLLEKTVETCVDDEVIVMFRDRFFQWAFMSFVKKHYTTVNTEPQRAEGVEGRFRYNVDSSDTIRLNTNFVSELWNDLFRDLIATEDAFIVENLTGDLTPVTVVPNTFSLQTSRNSNLIQYSLTFRKAIDNFKP